MKMRSVYIIECIVLMSTICIIGSQKRASELLFLEHLRQYVMMSNTMFEQYPMLGKKLAYVSLGSLPTLVEKLENIGNELGIANLYIKRDDLSGGKDRRGNALFGKKGTKL